jgi:Polysaccharide pyruvyl transferase
MAINLGSWRGPPRDRKEGDVLPSRRQFGLLSYSTYNLGDQIQSIAARRFLPGIDYYIDREALDEFHPSENEQVKVIMNGWYCHRADKWPPSPSIDPLLISIHISDYLGEGSGLRASEAFAESPAVIRYFQQHGPVGARDHGTLELLRTWGIYSYFSGCLTLTLERPEVERESDLVVLCDVPDAVAAIVDGTKLLQVQRTAHRNEKTKGIEARFGQAQALVDIYARAGCVVTTRLHCALPCLAMGTPVLFLDTAPGTYRFSGLIDLVHHCSVERFVSGNFAYELAAPPPNPTAHLPLRQALVDRARTFCERRTLGPTLD